MTMETKIGSDSSQIFKDYFKTGDGSVEHPFEVKPLANIHDVLRNAVPLTNYLPDHTVRFVFNENTFALNDALELTPVNPDKTQYLKTVKESLGELIKNEHLDKYVRRLSDNKADKNTLVDYIKKLMSRARLRR